MSVRKTDAFLGDVQRQFEWYAAEFDADDVHGHGEIGTVLGPLKSKFWRESLMGETSSKANVKVFLSAIAQILNDSRSKRERRLL